MLTAATNSAPIRDVISNVNRVFPALTDRSKYHGPPTDKVDTAWEDLYECGPWRLVNCGSVLKSYATRRTVCHSWGPDESNGQPLNPDPQPRRPVYHFTGRVSSPPLPCVWYILDFLVI